ncbi:hypothetical protein QYM36_000552 [Artemia franciscana]|uniref:Uncharacterized protein n=1 Tax=Artemia franciscana TaxID=6661 RepID=A0AA88LGM2_ARTSF|nr:hypothetical protein QYM36_000552 [Artemia franciscana]
MKLQLVSFEEHAKDIEGIPQQNIMYYDKMNLTDKLGKKNVFVNCSMKYPEKVINSSKASVLLMMTVIASGIVVPPYVGYRVIHLPKIVLTHLPPDENGGELQDSLVSYLREIQFGPEAILVWQTETIIQYAMAHKKAKSLVG